MKKVKQFTILILVMAIMSCLPVRVMAAKTNKVNMGDDYNKSKLLKLGKNTATSNDSDKKWVKYVAEEDGVYKITFSNLREKGKKSKKSDGVATLGIATYDPNSDQEIIYFDSSKWSNGAYYPGVEIMTTGRPKYSWSEPTYKLYKKVKVNAGTIIYISVTQNMAVGSSHKAQIDINLKKVK